MCLDYSMVRGTEARTPACRQSAGVCQTFSAKFYILNHEPGGCWTKEKRCLRLMAPPAPRVREVLWECDASSHRFRPDWCGWPINMRGVQLPDLKAMRDWGFVKSVYSFETDRIKVRDDF